MLRVVVIYDIINNKSRRLISDILEGYGIRVNKSVFECELKSKKAKQIMIEDILKVVNSKRDSVRIYTICQKCLKTSKSLCFDDEPFAKESVYFI